MSDKDAVWGSETGTSSSASEAPRVSLPPGFKSGAEAMLPPQEASPDFLFPENFDESFRRSWGERLTFHAGGAYLVGARAAPRAAPPARARRNPPQTRRTRRPHAPPAAAARRRVRPCAGLTAGGVVGLGEGLRESQGERRRIRINSVLNAVGRKGPGWGNSLGCIAMLTSIFESIAYNARGVDDLFNPAGAAALTGTLYKITAGPKVALPFGLGLGALAGIGSLVVKQFSSRGMLKSVF